MGPSGSGKSTLMHILAGLDQPTSGSVEIAGARLDALNDQKLTLLRRSQIGFIFQSYNLLPVLTAEENMLLPVRIAGERADPAWLETLIEATGLEDRRTHRPSELSGGQQQRVAVARALITRPAVIFADEPTGNLDSAAGRDVLALLRRAVDEFGQTIVMVTHDADRRRRRGPRAVPRGRPRRRRARRDGRGGDPRPPQGAGMILLALRSLGNASCARR